MQLISGYSLLFRESDGIFQRRLPITIIYNSFVEERVVFSALYTLIYLTYVSSGIGNQFS